VHSNYEQTYPSNAENNKVLLCYKYFNSCVSKPRHRSRIPPGPPICIMRPVATFVGYAYTIKIKQQVQQLDILLMIIFPRAAYEIPTKSVVALCRKNVWTPMSSFIYIRMLTNAVQINIVL